MINNKIAIVICAHHKPWLLMSTLVALAAQDYKDFDLYFLYQAGDGSCPQRKSYQDYLRLSEKGGKFLQLSPYDQRIKEIVSRINFKNLFEIELENDHALDSGAWYKFIKTKTWLKYDYVFFIQEGALFTRDNVVSAALDFVKKKDIGFLSSAHEKRKWPKDILLSCNSRGNNPQEMDLFHDQRLKEVFSIFCRDSNFKKLFNEWSVGFNVTTQNHLPNIALSPLSFKLRRIVEAVKRKDLALLSEKVIYENAQRRFLKDVVGDYTEYNGVIFHKEINPEWFGCSCQHLLSRKFLELFSQKLEEHSIYEVLDIPFCAGALEVIWGFLPKWLGFDKWFFDGIHRVRKDFVTYKREDDCAGMCCYINKYFHGKFHVVPSGDFLKIDRINHRYRYLKEILGKEFFVER